MLLIVRTPLRKAAGLDPVTGAGTSEDGGGVAEGDLLPSWHTDRLSEEVG